MSRTRSQIPVLGKYKRHKLRLVRASQGIPTTVDAGAPLARLGWLMSIGFTNDSIGAAAGLPPQTIWWLLQNRPARIHIERATRIMAVTHVPVPAQSATLVPSIGTRRRLQGLQAIGHPLVVLADELGVTRQALSQHIQRPTVHGATWEKIRDLYERRSGTHGGSRSAAIRARRRGCVPPLDWEGLDIDHPDHAPVPAEHSEDADLVVVHRILLGTHKGEIPTAERRAVVAHAAVKGWTAARLAEALDVSHDAAEAALTRKRRKNREAAA